MQEFDPNNSRRQFLKMATLAGVSGLFPRAVEAKISDGTITEQKLLQILQEKDILKRPIIFDVRQDGDPTTEIRLNQKSAKIIKITCIEDGNNPNNLSALEFTSSKFLNTKGGNVSISDFKETIRKHISRILKKEEKSVTDQEIESVPKVFICAAGVRSAYARINAEKYFGLTNTYSLSGGIQNMTNLNLKKSLLMPTMISENK
jgi:rhodanese-related sulfurtransferase